jgi:hypothetical protein
VSIIREAVRKGEEETTVRFLNYKKSGKPFWNMFTLAPMVDVDGTLRFMIGVQVGRAPTLPQAPLQGGGGRTAAAQGLTASLEARPLNRVQWSCCARQVAPIVSHSIL